MSAATSSNCVTAEQFADMASRGDTCELIEGRVRTMSPAGGNHGFVGMRLLHLSDHSARLYAHGETLVGGDVLPGFSLPLKGLFV